MCLSAVAKAEMLTQLSLFSICRGSSWADLCVALVANAKWIVADEQKDEMQKLEEKARELAEEAVRDQAKPDKGILFVRLVWFYISVFRIERL